MSLSSVDSVERTVHKTNEWLADLAGELGTDDRDEAWRVFRAYLQLVRDRLTLDEAAQLSAQLPHLLRGIFWEGFDPGHQPAKVRHRETFLALLGERAGFADDDRAAQAAAAATRVLRRHVSEGEIDDVLAQLPEEVREVLRQD
jgi:uncharacterized protein (DUF2267 family)